uniref:Dehydrogenase/reductase SDR family member 4 n=1 Tax=Ascaris lumbricoides TaxID=6252 RepID=A0A9J2PUF8_ASCLU
MRKCEKVPMANRSSIVDQLDRSILRAFGFNHYKGVICDVMDKFKYKSCRLMGKTAIVTAATSGIGLAIAERLGHEGAAIIISSRNDSNVKRSVEFLQRSGVENVAGTICHIGDAQHREKLVDFVRISLFQRMKEGEKSDKFKNVLVFLHRNFNLELVCHLLAFDDETLQAVKKYGRIDILVNNAGINPIFCDILEVNETTWDKLFDINVKASFLLTKLVIPYMEKVGGGSVIFNASFAAYKSPPGIALYGITKTTVIALTKALANSLANKNIRVNCIAPGIVKTKMSSALWSRSNDETIASNTFDEIALGRYGTAEECAGTVAFLLWSRSNDETIASNTFDEIALGRYGTAEECAGTVAFLVSNDASYITGESIIIAGGAQARL